MSIESEKQAKELRDRFVYFFMKIDGTYEFPNSADGDLLRMTHKLLQQLKEDAQNDK